MKANKSKASILIVDDEENMRHMLAAMLSKAGYHTETAGNGREAVEKVSSGSYDYILCDIKMPVMDGMEFLKSAARLLEDTTVIMMSAYGTIDLAVEAMKLGAYDFISKPFKPDEVRLAIKKAEERERLKQENLKLRRRLEMMEAKDGFGNLVAKSPAMQSVFKLARKVAAYDTTVLITGESGTGKELLARAIHQVGPRSKGPWVPVNCGGIPENLLESELFGHVKGAFTGADRSRAGLFAEADGGTIFLDEIGELPLSLQVKLLRVLQESEVRPVGGQKTRRVDVRVIAATSRDLGQAMADGSFREDLFYRLNVMPIHMPPLRQRPEDIPPLCRHFIAKFNAALDRRIEGIAPAAMKLLLRHLWPGNVRELENAIERAMVLCEGDRLGPENFAGIIDGLAAGRDAAALFDGFSIKAAQRVVEKALIEKALQTTGGNRTQAARLLEISHPSLLAKIKAYGLDL